MDIAIISDWLTPAMIVATANGNSTLNSIWKGVAPNERAASLISGETCRSARLVNLIAGGVA